MPDLTEFIIVKGKDKAYPCLYDLSDYYGLVLVLPIDAEQIPAIFGELISRLQIARYIRRRLFRCAGANDVETAATLTRSRSSISCLETVTSSSV